MRHLAIAVIVVAFAAASLIADLTGTDSRGWGMTWGGLTVKERQTIRRKNRTS